MSQAPNAQQSTKFLPQHSVVTQSNPPPALQDATKQAATKLTRKQRLFVENYVQDFNASRAYREVYKENGGMERQKAFKLLQKDYIRVYLDRKIEEVSEPLKIRAEKTMRELRAVGFSNMKNYLSFGKDGMKWKESAELTDEQLAAVSQVSETITQHGGTRSIKLHDKIPALIKYGETAKLFAEDKLKDINIAVQVVNVR